MRYRPLGRSGLMVSELSFGCGRLPEDDAESTRVLRAAVDAGITYFETADFYCGGRCQQKAGLGLQGLTNRVIVSPKIGVPPEATADSYRKELERQLTVLGLDHAEWFMVGWLSLEGLEHLTKQGGALEAIEQARSEGLIKHIGFTGHDTPENFCTILRSGLFESMTVSYHLLNRTYEPAIAVARELGVGVIVMNPVGGGLLGSPSARLQELVPAGAVTSTAAVALRFVLSNPGVSTACSGISSVEMVADNVAAVEGFSELSEAEHLRLRAILDQFKALGEKFCTGCRYCMPCPQGVEIPTCFNLYNLFTVYGLGEAARRSYAGMEPGKRASACIKCGECEAKCPNKLPIMAQLEEVTGVFEQAAVS